MVLKLVFVLFLSAGYCFARVPTRIIGGELTTIEHHTSLVQLEYFLDVVNIWSDSCAGSILNSRYILTAAHCLGDIIQWRVRAGTSYLGVGGQTVDVLRWIVHPSFGQFEKEFDISLLELQGSLIYSAVVQQATIPPQGYEVPDNSPVVYAGWGSISTDKFERSHQLRDVTVYTVNNELCRDNYGVLDPPRIVTDTMICAGIIGEGGKDACGGDSGGPLYYSNVLVGVISWSHGCANGTYPGVNTKVASYTNWIVETAV